MSTLMMSLWAFSAFADVTRSEYQPAVVLGVKAHEGNGAIHSSTQKFDVMIQAEQMIYTVLAQLKIGGRDIQYRAGLELLVQVNGVRMKIKYFGGSRELPLLKQEPAGPSAR